MLRDGKAVTVLYLNDFNICPTSPPNTKQVYRGVLLGGEEVAVKVQRPGVGVAIALDVFILRWVQVSFPSKF